MGLFDFIYKNGRKKAGLPMPTTGKLRKPVSSYLLPAAAAVAVGASGAKYYKNNLGSQPSLPAASSLNSLCKQNPRAKGCQAPNQRLTASISPQAKDPVMTDLEKEVRSYDEQSADLRAELTSAIHSNSSCISNKESAYADLANSSRKMNKPGKVTYLDLQTDLQNAKEDYYRMVNLKSRIQGCMNTQAQSQTQGSQQAMSEFMPGISAGFSGAK